MISVMAKVTKSTKTGMYTRATSKTEKPMAPAYSNGILARPMTANGREASRTGQVSGEASKASTTSVSGRIPALTAKESMSGATEINMRVNGKMDLSMAKDVTFSGE